MPTVTDATDLVKAQSIWRRARKLHRCHTCVEPICPGDYYVEYIGETPDFQSGHRYCLVCVPAQLGFEPTRENCQWR